MLSTQGPQTADQRFGVLLSLTRGAILDPELAVSYALELGKDNPSYMRAVLEATAQKNYSQLAQAFKMTCLQRFGVEKAAEICKDDALAERSDAIAQVIQDELEAVGGGERSRPSTGRCRSCATSARCRRSPARWPGCSSRTCRISTSGGSGRRSSASRRSRPGARLVAALVLATARTGELVSASESAALDKFHADRRKWLVGYLLGPDLRPRLPRQAGRRDAVVVRRGGGRLRRAAASACCGSRTPRRRRRSATCTRACSGARSTPTIWRRSATACWCRR